MPSDDGGPAFPFVASFAAGTFDPISSRQMQAHEAAQHVFAGMSARCYIATKALAAIIAKGPQYVGHDLNDIPENVFTASAEGAVRYADALIAKLKETQ